MFVMYDLDIVQMKVILSTRRQWSTGKGILSHELYHVQGNYLLKQIKLK